MAWTMNVRSLGHAPEGFGDEPDCPARDAKRGFRQKNPARGAKHGFRQKSQAKDGRRGFRQKSQARGGRHGFRQKGPARDAKRDFRQKTPARGGKRDFRQKNPAKGARPNVQEIQDGRRGRDGRTAWTPQFRTPQDVASMMMQRCRHVFLPRENGKGSPTETILPMKTMTHPRSASNCCLRHARRCRNDRIAYWSRPMNGGKSW